MICPKCGAEVTGGAESCASCGERIPDPSSQVESADPNKSVVPPVVYAGFWRRVAAYAFDSLVLGLVVGFAVLQPLMTRAGIPADNPWVLLTGNSRQILAINLLLTMASWIYWAWLESSPWQATLGKKIFGIEVTDLSGRRISFGRATGRYFGKIIFVGFILVATTEKKQALHDILAGCLVVRKPAALPAGM